MRGISSAWSRRARLSDVIARSFHSLAWQQTSTSIAFACQSWRPSVKVGEAAPLAAFGGFTRMDLGPLGVDALTDSITGAELAKFARKVENLGYSALWFPEAFGRDPFALAAHLLTTTEKLIVGTAIANVWKREPMAMIGAARTLAEIFPDRFVLGIGVSHGPMMSRVGINYAKPLAFMREYLTRMKSAPYGAPRPKAEPPVLIAALLPKMLRLA